MMAKYLDMRKRSVYKKWKRGAVDCYLFRLFRNLVKPNYNF